MEIKKNQIDALNVELTMEVAAADYAEIERKKLAERRRNAEFKGFRKGNVPASLIQKVYGSQILVESVNQVVGENLDAYIKGEGLNIIGEPLASEKQPELDWTSGKDFTFVFDLGLTPEIALEVGKEDTVSLYNITPAAETVKKMKENLKKYKEEQKQEATDEEIDKEVSETLSRTLAQEADYQLGKDIRAYLVEKAGGVPVPEAFLRRWLLYANEGKVTEEQVDKEFPAFIKDYKWQLVRVALMRKFDLKVTEQDMFDAAENYVRYQYSMYGLPEVPQDMVQDAAHRLLQDGRMVGNLDETVQNNKVMDKVKSLMTIKNKKIGEEKFRAL